MVAPNRREEAAVSGIQRLDKASLERLIQVTTALGYANKQLAEILQIEPDAITSAFAGELSFSGAALLKLCRALKLRPGVVQGLRNFDADETPIGSKAWQGPHELFVKGHPRLGSFFKAAILSSGNLHGLTSWEVNQIGNGNRPVSLAVVRELLATIPKKAGGLIPLERASLAMPKQVLTVSEYERSKTVLMRKEQMSEIPSEAGLVWDEEKVQVHVGGRTFSLKPGHDMAAVATRIRALIERDAEKPKIGEVLNFVLGREEFSASRAKVLASVEKGNGTLSTELILGVAKHYNIPNEALFTGIGLGFTDPVKDVVTASDDSIDDTALKEWCRDQLLTRGTKLVPDVDPYDLVDFARRADDMTVDWIRSYLKMTIAGAELKKDFDEVAVKISNLKPEPKRIFWKLLKDTFF